MAVIRIGRHLCGRQGPAVTVPSFRPLIPADETALLALFREILDDPASGGFRPHPYDAETASRLVRHAGLDAYLVAQAEGTFVAYGMLRGWDEGYSVPSLGIYLSPGLRGTGAADPLMHDLHRIAARAGATQVRLTVDASNERAIRLYRRLGYRLRPHAQPDRLVGVVELPNQVPEQAP